MFACLWVRVSCAACLWRTPEWQTGRVFTRLEVQGGCYLMYRCRCWLLFVFVFVRLCTVWCVSETRCDIYLNPSGCFMTSAEGFLTISATSPPSLAELYVLFLASLRLLKSFLVDWVEDLLMLQVDFEATVQENRFTVKPNVDPAMDESKGSLHRFFLESLCDLVELNPFCSPVREEEDGGIVWLLDRRCSKRTWTSGPSSSIVLCHLHPFGQITAFFSCTEVIIQKVKVSGSEYIYLYRLDFCSLCPGCQAWWRRRTSRWKVLTLWCVNSPVGVCAVLWKPENIDLISHLLVSLRGSSALPQPENPGARRASWRHALWHQRSFSFSQE